MQQGKTDALVKSTACNARIVFISRKEVERITGMSRSWLYLAMSEDRFPRPVTCSASSVRWVLHEVELWQEERIRERDVPHRPQRPTAKARNI